MADSVLLALADHLAFSLARTLDGTPEIEHPLYWEVTHLYPDEVSVAREAIALVARERGVRSATARASRGGAG